MIEQHRMGPDDLDGLFHSARQRQPLPDELFARIMADAAEEVARRDEAVAPGRSGGLWAAILDTVGGWPSLAGLATATPAGPEPMTRSAIA